MRKLDPAATAERLTACIESVLNDYEQGKLRAGSDTHPIKRLNDDWDPETGISNENMMRMVAERMHAQGILIYFDPETARQNIMNAARAVKPPQ
ncbi:hypothetical protein SEA_WHOSEMANZ_56 [Gordonia phage WhoseManz]|nr:hypothetical protein SEA_WHOSEMANZ_56 [Gordonia phage WhoseManz]